MLADVMKQTERMLCDTRAVAREVAAGKEVVPKFVYHFGPRKFIDEDIAAGNVPQKAWDQFIMNAEDRALGATRRGLYVTAGIETNFYGEKGADQALLEVQLKDSCRAPSGVAPYRYLPRSPAFRAWYDKLPTSARPFASPEEMEKKCYLPFGGYPIATKYGFDPKKDCGRVVLRYFDEANIKIVVDHHREKAFYIRDRDCIEKLRGTPADLLDMATRNPMLWMPNCNPEGNWGAAAFSDGVLRALLETKEPIPAATLDKIIEHAKLARRGRRFEDYKMCARKNQLEKFKAAYEKPEYNLARAFSRPCED